MFRLRLVSGMICLLFAVPVYAGGPFISLAPPKKATIKSAPAQAAECLVPFDHWAYDAVQQLIDMGIIIGYPDGCFRGDRTLTRYEFAMALSRLLDAIGQFKRLPGQRGE